MMHADRASRVLLTLFGLLLVVAGAAGLVAGFSVFAPRFGDRSLLDNPAARYIGTNSAWFWPAVAAFAFLIALLALRWLVAVLRPMPRTSDINVRAAATTGRTNLHAAALRDALSTEITGYRGVDSTSIRVLGSPSAPRLAVKVNADRDTDLAALRQRLESQALSHARQALDDPNLHIRLDLTITGNPSQRVR